MIAVVCPPQAQAAAVLHCDLQIGELSTPGKDLIRVDVELARQARRKADLLKSFGKVANADCLSTQSGKPGVTQHNFVPAVFVVTDVLAPLTVVPGRLAERRHLDLDTLRRDMFARSWQRNVHTGQLHQILDAGADHILDDRIGWRPQRNKHIDGHNHSGLNRPIDQTL